ncbi:sufE-like protein 1, chloroplastic/mitochondrial [Typha angustifolia]|uniref:sufE-like protein 1, chloroplastic/mitochondrial n=1 Tax=Typha angustifolia TaxID=59011 RepID=UPI003C2B2629
MTSLSSSLRLFSPNPLFKPPSFVNPLLAPKPLLFSSPISFQSLTKSSLPRPQPIKAQLQDHPSNLDYSVLPAKLQEIISLFQSVDDTKAKYQQLLHYGTRLPPLAPEHKVEANKVRGCVSQVWVRAFRDSGDDGGGCVRFEADSDSALTKGLAALLVFGLSGEPAKVIARVPAEFIDLLGLRQSLTPSRNSGMLNMLKLMQQKALQLDAVAGDSGEFGVLDDKGGVLAGENLTLDGKTDGIGEISLGKDFSVPVEDDSLEDLNDANPVKPNGWVGGREKRIRERLEKGLSPTELQIEDISHVHAGHAGVAGNSGGETHFNLRVVSKEFEGKSLLKRHRLVYDLLQEELNSGLHALSIEAKTPSEV